MAQFDVHHLASRRGKSFYVIDLQHGFLEDLATRLTAPVYPLETGGTPLLRLNPQVEIEGKRYYIAVPEITAMHAASLGKKIASLERQRAEIIAALDFLFTGV